MYCPNCGMQIQDGQRFCPNCGVSLENIQSNTSVENNTPQQYNVGYIKPKKKKKWLIAVVVIFAIFIIAVSAELSISDPTNSNTSNLTENKTVSVLLDANKFIIADEKRTVSESELIEMLGSPDSVEEWNFSSGALSYPIRTLTYGDKEYSFNNDLLHEISFINTVEYENKEDILAMFGLKQYRNSTVTDTGVAYRVYTCGVHDFWCFYDENSKTLSDIKIRYSDLFE